MEATCTYGPMATTGKPCGKPAVEVRPARFGFTPIAECEEHLTRITPVAVAKPTTATLKGCYRATCMDYYAGPHYAPTAHIRLR